MPTRFRKTITIFPGVKANISKGGVSFSLGRRGFTINVGKNGVRRTVGLPGSGVSNTEYISKKDHDEDEEKGKEEEGPLGGTAAALLGMAAMNAVDKDDDEEKEERRAPKKAKTAHKRAKRAKADKAQPGDGYALRGLIVFAAIAIGVYLSSIVIPRLPSTWPSDLMNLILQWAVQFGH